MAKSSLGKIATSCPQWAKCFPPCAKPVRHQRKLLTHLDAAGTSKIMCELPGIRLIRRDTFLIFSGPFPLRVAPPICHTGGILAIILPFSLRTRRLLSLLCLELEALTQALAIAHSQEFASHGQDPW